MVSVGLRSVRWSPVSPVVFVVSLSLRWSSVVSVGLRSLRWSPWSPVVFGGLRGSP